MKHMTTEDMLTMFRNGAYKEHGGKYLKHLQNLANRSLVSSDGKFTEFIAKSGDKNTTVMIDLFLKDLAEVFTMDKSADFATYALILDAEKPSARMHKPKIEINTATRTMSNGNGEMVKLFKVLGTENALYAIISLEKVANLIGR